MKTIFISMFEGVEVKNILRTDIVPTLLSDPEVRLVLLMKSKERVELYQKEFNDPRITYEVVPYVRSLGRGFDRIFAGLKYTLLRTETTILQRTFSREVDKNYIAYGVGYVVNFLLARPSVRRIVRVLDFLLVRSTLYAAVFDTHKPDLVFLAHLFEEPEIHILREAKRRKIRTIGFINSWDKVTARCIMRLLPQKAVVFNTFVKRGMLVHNDMREEDIVVAGIPQYDRYWTKPPLSRETFMQQIGINSQNKLIVYAPIGSTVSTGDWDMIDFLDILVREGRFGKNVALLIRFQPNDFVDERELKKRPHLYYDYPGKRFSMTRGVDWDMGEADLAHLKNTLFFMDLLICYASSISIDAVVFDKPVININFEFKKQEHLSKSPMKYYRTTHYREALNTGGIRLVDSKEKLIEWTARYLEDPARDHAERMRLVDEQCEFRDGRSGERIGKFILSNLSQHGTT